MITSKKNQPGNLRQQNVENSLYKRKKWQWNQESQSLLATTQARWLTPMISIQFQIRWYCYWWLPGRNQDWWRQTATKRIEDVAKNQPQHHHHTQRNVRNS